MKTVLVTAILATASPIALAQHTGEASASQTLSIAQQKEMAGEAVKAPLPNAIETRITNDALESKLGETVHPSVVQGARRAYAQKMFEPIWTEDGAASLQTASSNLFAYGLTSSSVTKSDLEQLIDQRFSAESDEEKAKADIALTGAWLKLAAAVSGGLKDEGEAAKSRASQPSYAMLSEKLISAGQGDADRALQDFEPKMTQYAELKAALQSYRQIRDNGGWLAIKDGDVIEAGMSDPRIPAIRERLAMEGYESERSLMTMVSSAVEAGTAEEKAPVSSAAAASEIRPVDVESVKESFDPTQYDERLVAAVKTFQKRHGIKVDGVIGPKTLAAMNESVDSKIARIADTMNRWRAQGQLSDRYVWANIPSYTAEGWKNNKRDISVKTIVGARGNETPTFNDEIEYAVANPRWYMPVSITRNEKVPKLRQDPGYAQRANYKVYSRATGEEVSAYSVNWSDPSAAQNYRLVQQSGPNNALGQLKIIFPNQYSVYLHDTPGKHLFDRAERAFSHGCIRLEEPTQLAGWIAEETSTGNVADVEKAVSARTREKLEFKRRVPIHITYMTVTTNDDGTVNFWRDIYDRTEGIRQVEKFAPLHEAEESIQTAELERG